MRKIVAIHQPNFFPWLGYFDKISRADIFLVMDNVQFPRTSRGTWCNRVKLIVGRRAAWVTMPIVRTHSELRIIRDMQIDNSKDWREKLLRSIKINYCRASFFKEIFPFIEKLVNNPTNNLVEYNLTAIRSLVSALQLSPDKLILGSSLGVKGNATDLLIAMIKAIGGSAYLCGGGAAGYQEDNKFSEAGIELVYQNFKHPTYEQYGVRKFIPGLSIMDSLFNIGLEGTKKLLDVSPKV